MLSLLYPCSPSTARERKSVTDVAQGRPPAGGEAGAEAAAAGATGPPFVALEGLENEVAESGRFRPSAVAS